MYGGGAIQHTLHPFASLLVLPLIRINETTAVQSTVAGACERMKRDEWVAEKQQSVDGGMSLCCRDVRSRREMTSEWGDWWFPFNLSFTPSIHFIRALYGF